MLNLFEEEENGGISQGRRWAKHTLLETDSQLMKGNPCLLQPGSCRSELR